MKDERLSKWYDLTGRAVVLTGATGKLGKIRCAVKGDGTSRLVEFSAGPNNVFKKDSNWPASFLAVSTTDPIFIDLWSSDGGLTVYGQYHGQFTS